MSLLVVVSANSWFIAWLGLEINLLSFIPLILFKKNKYSTESALKYFLVQALASVVIITATSLNVLSDLSTVAISMAVFTKIGAAPSHQWMPAMVDGLSWGLVAVLITLQKVNPFVLIFFLSKNDQIYKIIFAYITLSALVGSIGGLTQTSLRKISAYSSITHISWLLASILCGSWAWASYFMVYALVLISFISLINKTQSSDLNHITTINKSYQSFIIAASVLSLGGLPPFTGFLPKFLIVTQLRQRSQLILALPLLTGTFISLFFYARVLLTSLLLSRTASNSGLSFKRQTSGLLYFNIAGLLVPSACIIIA